MTEGWETINLLDESEFEFVPHITGLVLTAMLTTQATGIYLYETGLYEFSSTPTDTTQTATDPMLAGYFVGGVILFSAFAIAASKLWSRIPDIIKHIAAQLFKLAAGMAFILPVGTALYNGNYTAVAGLVGTLAAVLAAAYIIDASGLSWLLFDGFIVAAATFFAGNAGSYVPPFVLAILIVLLGVYDHIAVHHTSVMESVVNTTFGRMQMFVVPNKLFVHGRLLPESKGEEPHEALDFVIGLGDFFIPSAFVISVWVAHGPVFAFAASAATALAIIYATSIAKPGASPGIPLIGGSAVIAWLIALAAREVVYLA